MVITHYIIWYPSHASPCIVCLALICTIYFIEELHISISIHLYRYLVSSFHPNNLVQYDCVNVCVYVYIEFPFPSPHFCSDLIIIA